MADEGELAELTIERDRLRLQKEAAVLRAEIRGAQAPWWRNVSAVTILTSILAAIVPVTSAVQGHFQKQREIALEESKQAHAIAMEREKQTDQIRTGYLDRMKAPGEHLRTLRFVIATTPDATLLKWAEGEKVAVEAELAKLDEEIRTTEANSAVAAGQIDLSGTAGADGRDLVLLRKQRLFSRNPPNRMPSRPTTPDARPPSTNRPDGKREGL